VRHQQIDVRGRALMAARPLVQLDGLTKRFGRALAVDQLTLDLAPGEVVGFLGPNGAGKTTTLRLLMGFLRPDAGTATLNGLDCWRDSTAVHRYVGYLPGDVRLWPRWTGRETLRYLAAVRGLPLSDDTAQLAKRLDVDLDLQVSALSKGNRQKIGILIALIADSQVLLLDEPTGGLDPLVQQEFHRIVRERTEAGACVLLSSHVLSEVERVADRVAIIRSGRLIVLESLAELRDKATHTVQVRFREPPPADAFTRVPGIRDVHLDGTSLHCTLQGVVDPFIKALAQFDVLDLNSHETDLEETFLALYGESVTP
jgi:ABC-2 type transport system ATP-binding protein